MPLSTTVTADPLPIIVAAGIESTNRTEPVGGGAPSERPSIRPEMPFTNTSCGPELDATLSQVRPWKSSGISEAGGEVMAMPTAVPISATTQSRATT